MTSNKENNTNATSGPGPSPRTKLAISTQALSLRDSDDTLVEANDHESATHDGLDGVVTGSCSTCGSDQHGTVKCDSKDPPPELMMSGALQTAQGTNMTADWRAQAALTALLRASGCYTGPAQLTGRRNSV